jgi:hypothetical protein
MNFLFVLVIEQQLSLVHFLTVLGMNVIHRFLARIRCEVQFVLILKLSLAKNFLGIEGSPI